MNENGLIRIGKGVHFFSDTKQFIVPLNNKSKIETLIESGESIENLGEVHTMRMNLELRSCGSSWQNHYHSDGSNFNSTRVAIGQDGVIFVDHNYENSILVSRDFALSLYTHVEHKRKKAFGWKKLHEEDLKFNAHWDFHYDFFNYQFGNHDSGMGWTQNSWEINHYRSIAGPITLPANVLPSEGDINWHFEDSGGYVENEPTGTSAWFHCD